MVVAGSTWPLQSLRPALLREKCIACDWLVSRTPQTWPISHRGGSRIFIGGGGGAKAHHEREVHYGWKLSRARLRTLEALVLFELCYLYRILIQNGIKNIVDQNLGRGRLLGPPLDPPMSHHESLLIPHLHRYKLSLKIILYILACMGNSMKEFEIRLFYVVSNLIRFVFKLQSKKKK